VQVLGAFPTDHLGPDILKLFLMHHILAPQIINSLVQLFILFLKSQIILEIILQPVIIITQAVKLIAALFFLLLNPFKVLLNLIQFLL